MPVGALAVAAAALLALAPQSAWRTIVILVAVAMLIAAALAGRASGAIGAPLIPRVTALSVQDVVPFTALILLVIVAGRVLLEVSGKSGPSATGFWVDDTQCHVLACIYTPDSDRYTTAASVFHATGGAYDVQARMHDGLAFQGSKNGLFFSFLAGQVIGVFWLTAGQALTVVALASGIALAFVLRSYVLEASLPFGALAVFFGSSLLAIYSTVAMKETFDALLLALVLIAIERPRRWRVVLAAVAAYCLYWDREYYLYLAGIFLVVRGFMNARTVAARAAWITGAATAAAYVMLVRGFTPSYLQHDYFAKVRPGATFLSPSSAATGFVRTLVSPISPHMSSVEFVQAVFNVPILVGCAFLLYWLLTPRAWAGGWRGAVYGLFNPYLVVFFVTIVGFGIVYGGFYRAREALTAVFVLGIAHAAASRRGVDELPYEMRLSRSSSFAPGAR